MVLRMTSEELDLMRMALLDSVRSVRDTERVHCAGPSCTAIELCRKRLRLEALLDSVDEQRIAFTRAASQGRVETIPLRTTAEPDFFPDLVA